MYTRQTPSSTKRHGGQRGIPSRTAVFLAGAFGLAAVSCYASYRSDRVELRRRAQELVRDIHDPEQKVLALNSWIHRSLKTARNESYFMIPRLRATPLQVLQGGGDCADKARLLSAMLHEIHIPATMALCFHPKTGQPSHTVVEAQPQPGRHMLIDPAYELYYPKPGGVGYYGLLELRQHPERLQERLTYVWETVPRFRPLHWYNPNVASFFGLSTVNWNRNQVTKLVRDVLFLFLGPDVYRLPRPAVLEEPKLALCATSVLLTLLFSAAHLAVRHRASRSHRNREAVIKTRGSRRASGAHAAVPTLARPL